MRSVSIEAPEASILGHQLGEGLTGQILRDLRLEDVERLQKNGFVNDDVSAFDALIDHEVKTVRSRGAGFIIDFDGAVHLVIAPEYGGRVRLVQDEKRGEKAHLIAYFDTVTLTVRLTGMGGLQVWPTHQLDRSFSHQRDFTRGLDPLNLNRGEFLRQLTARTEQLKKVIVGREAVPVGLGNACFQDIMFRSGIHPVRRADTLSDEERGRIYDATTDLMDDRLSLDGKVGFEDAHGRPGRYEAPMASGKAGEPCPVCTTAIVKIKHGGGEVGFCPQCQT